MNRYAFLGALTALAVGASAVVWVTGSILVERWVTALFLGMLA